MDAVGKWVAGILAVVIATVLSAVLVQRLTEPDQPPPPSQQAGGVAALYLNRDSGPAGTRVRLSGRGFTPGESVTIRFHTETVAHTSADEQGGFADVSARVPEDWSFSGQFTFVATGEQSIASAQREFRVT